MATVGTGTLALLSLILLAAVITMAVLTPRGVLIPLTGHATTDTGYVNLTINGTLAIAVDATNATVDFGGCIPRAGTSYWCATNDSITCDNNNSGGNCTGDTPGPQFIRVDNAGNVDANVTVQSACNASSLIGGTSPAFQYITAQCNGTGVSSWTEFSSSSFTSACGNLSYLGGQLLLYANVTIPSNAVGGSGSCANQSTITFTAVQSG